MLPDSLTKVKAGLQKGMLIVAGFMAAAVGLGFARFYAEYLFDPTFPLVWVYGYLALAIPLAAAVVWYQAYRFNPRMVRFVEGMSGRLREADYVPWGTKKRGLMLTFDSGLLLTVSRNFVAFRILVDSDGTLLHPGLDAWPSLLNSYRGSARRASVTTRKGDPRLVAELKELSGRLGGRVGMVSFYERQSLDPASSAAGRWTAVALISIPRWLGRGDAIRNALDDIQRLLEGLRAAPIS